MKLCRCVFGLLVGIIKVEGWLSQREVILRA